jgi:hypothetical protein
MKGTTYKRVLPSGKITWCFQVDAGRDENGKRIRIAKTGFKREQDADKELRLALQERDAGELVKPDSRTFAAFMQEWFKEHAEQKVTPKTCERYKELAPTRNRISAPSGCRTSPRSLCSASSTK